MSLPPRRLHLPEPDRAHWRAPEGAAHGLLYLSWGERRFGDAPIPCTRHDGWVFAVLESGAPYIVTAAGEERFEPGTALIIGPEFASGWTDSPRRRCRMLLWMFRDTLSGLLPRGAARGARRVGVPPGQLSRLRWLHAACRDEAARNDRASVVAIDGLQRLLEATLLRGMESPIAAPASEGSRLAAGLAWLEEHLDTAQPAARLADYLGVSVSTLFRLFKEELGTSPQAYFQRVRMEHARRQLEAHLPVKEIAYRLGYRHAGDLSRAYRRHFGHSPAALSGRNEGGRRS